LLGRPYVFFEVNVRKMLTKFATYFSSNFHSFAV